MDTNPDLILRVAIDAPLMRLFDYLPPRAEGPSLSRDSGFACPSAAVSGLA